MAILAAMEGWSARLGIRNAQSSTADGLEAASLVLGSTCRAGQEDSEDDQQHFLAKMQRKRIN